VFVTNSHFHPGANPMKLFTAVIDGFSQIAGVFVPGKPFQPSLMFAGKAGTYPSGAFFNTEV
jgi:hypothetical protein